MSVSPTTIRIVLLLANVYLAVFSMDSLAALADAFVGSGSQTDPSVWRRPFMTGALNGALPMVVLIGASPLLPKRALLPPLLFLAWAWFGALPVGVVMEEAQAAKIVAFVQLTVAAMSLLLLRRANRGAGWLVDEATTGRPASQGAYTAKFFLLTAFALPMLLSMLTLGYAGSVIVHSAGGFITLARDGVYADERVYTRDDKTVYLIGMVHVADRSFYENVFGFIPPTSAVILAEGVSDKDNRFQGDLSGVGRLAEERGLVHQSAVPMPTGIAIEFADIDAGDLSENSVEFVNALMAALDAGSLREGAKHLRPYYEASHVNEAVAAVDELIELRNAHLLERLVDALGRYDHVVVPWGAAHMPGIEEGVLSHGFELGIRRSRRVFGFADALAVGG
jgi:hypothetical protein